MAQGIHHIPNGEFGAQHGYPYALSSLDVGGGRAQQRIQLCILRRTLQQCF